MLANSRWYIEQGTHVRFFSGLMGLLLSRPFLEFEIRRRVLALPNVSSRTGAIVEGLVYDGSRRVTGVRCRDGTVAGDLIVDATGRAPHSPQWLEEIGFPKQHEDQVGIEMAYSTCLFRRDPMDLDGDVALVYGASPETGRSGAMLAQEGDRWIVTQAKYSGHNFPADVPSFIEYSRGLPTLEIYDVISKAEPLCEPAQARFPASLRRRYESLTQFPSGLSCLRRCYLFLQTGVRSRHVGCVHASARVEANVRRRARKACCAVFSAGRESCRQSVGHCRGRGSSHPDDHWAAYKEDFRAQLVRRTFAPCRSQGPRRCSGVSPCCESSGSAAQSTAAQPRGTRPVRRLFTIALCPDGIRGRNLKLEPNSSQGKCDHHSFKTSSNLAALFPGAQAE